MPIALGRQQAKLGAALVASILAACSTGWCEPSPELTPPTQLCVRHAAEPPCRSALEVEALLHSPDLALVSASPPPAGKQGTRVVALTAPGPNGPVRFRAKWRALYTAHGLNDPRRELAAFALQKLMFAPLDWVMPPTAGHCFDSGHYRTLLDSDAGPSFPETACVFGILTYWLEHARDLESAKDDGWLKGPDVLDRDAFERISSYRRSLADVNLLAHLASNGDTHRHQFILTGNRLHPRMYLIDYTISFSDYRNPTLGPKDDWSIIHVPLSNESLTRLRALRFEDLADLLVIEEYENRGGFLFPVARSAPLSRDEGMRQVGSRVQLGLTEAELSYVWSRLEGLLRAVDRGEIRSF